MKPKPFRTLLLNGVFWLAALAWIALDFRNGYRIDSRVVPLFLIAAGLVVLGDIFEIDLRGGRSTPVSNAVIFALFVVFDPPLVLLVVIPSFLIALVVRSRDFGWGPRYRSTSRRLGTMTFALGFYTSLMLVIPKVAATRDVLLTKTGVMVVAGIVYLLSDTGVSASLISLAQKVPVQPIWRSQLRNLAGLHVAFLSVSALIALAYGVLQHWAFVLFLLPLFAARHAFRRYASIHKTYEQTIRALAKAPELAGYASDGHSSAVADLAKTIARLQGMSDNEVQEVEFAALLHDVGRFFFEDPTDVPESFAGTRAGAQLAEASASIAGQTEYLTKVAGLVREQDKPFSEGPALGARIVKVANDFVELSREGPELSALTALHQMELMAGQEYDPMLVRSLRRALELRGVI
jgi:hypothetical protein